MTKIILIRHGESEGNVDPAIYRNTYDHDVKLTKKGKDQAKNVGKILKTILDKNELDIYVSPYKRTIETWEGIKKGLKKKHLNVELEPRLREQEHKIFRDSDERSYLFTRQKKMGKFWYRFSNGESGCDVYSRVNTFLTELRLDRKIFERENDIIIVTHEITIRSIIQKLFKLDISDFDKMPTIENCSPVVLETNDFKNVKLNHKETINNKLLKKFLKNKD